MGISVLVDFAGDDVYRGESMSSGAGVLGIGVLVDRAGDDRYEGTTWSQGAGVYGAGAWGYHYPYPYPVMWVKVPIVTERRDCGCETVVEEWVEEEAAPPPRVRRRAPDKRIRTTK